MKSDPRHLLATNLSAAMARQNLSQTALAHKSGVAQSTISYMARADSIVKSPTLDNIAALANALNMQVWELLVDPDTSRRLLLAQKIWATMAVQDDHLGEQWSAAAVHEPRTPYKKPPRK